MKTQLSMNLSLIPMVLLIAGMLIPSNGMTADHPKTGNYATGAKVWSENCGRCHNIRDARELRDDQWYSTVFHMRMRGGLTGQETRDVLAFLTASNKPARKSIFGATRVVSSPTANAADGRSVYGQTCIACHGADGKGTIPGAPDFTKASGAQSKSDAELIKNITEGFQSPGSPMAMPAKGGNTALNAGDIAAVLGYIRKFRK